MNFVCTYQRIVTLYLQTNKTYFLKLLYRIRNQFNMSSNVAYLKYFIIIEKLKQFV